MMMMGDDEDEDRGLSHKRGFLVEKWLLSLGMGQLQLGFLDKPPKLGSFEGSEPLQPFYCCNMSKMEVDTRNETRQEWIHKLIPVEVGAKFETIVGVQCLKVHI